MPKRITVILGHPDPGPSFCRALADAYADGAREAGHALRRIDVAALDFPLLRSAADFRAPEAPEPLRGAQADIAWAEHLVIVYPLWLGSMPALLKGFLEQCLRPGFAVEESAEGRWPKQRLAGRSARVVVTMGMPALIYRLFYGAHSLKSLERNILRFVGIRPVRETLIGMVEARADESRRRCLERLRALGRRGG